MVGGTEVTNLELPRRRQIFLCRWCLPSVSALYWWGPTVRNSSVVYSWSKSTNQFGERNEPLPDFVHFEICRFSQVVFIPQAQPHAQSLCLYSIAFGINLIYFFDFFDGKKNGVAGNSIVCFPASIPCHAIWQCEECALGRRLQRFRQRKVWAQRHSRGGEIMMQIFERKTAKLLANAKVHIF